MSKISSFVRKTVNNAIKNELTYHKLNNEMKIVRKLLEEKSPFYQKLKNGKKLPLLPSENQIKKFFKEVDKLNNPMYDLWALLPYTTGIRVREMVSILHKNINLEDRKIMIHGKGNKDRYVPILWEVNSLLKAHIKITPNSIFLFENNKRQYSTRRVQQLYKDCRIAAQIPFKMGPHTFRHIFLTALTKAGLNEAQIMKISGHSSKESLAIYQHLSLEDVRSDYENITRQQLNILN